MANEVTRPLDQILASPPEKLSKAEREIFDAFSLAKVRQETDETSHVGQPQKIEIAHSAQLFKLPGDISASSIDVVVMGSVVTRANYVSKEANSPMYCQSLGGKIGKPTEHGYQFNPDIDRNKTVYCRACPFGADDYGSDGAGKKCKEMRKLLVFHPSNMKPLMLSVPPTSVSNFDRYYDQVDSRGGVLAALWTKITLEERKRGQQKWSNFAFSAGNSIPADQFLACVKLRDLYQESIRSVDAGDYYSAETTASPSEAPVAGEDTNEDVDGLPF